MYNVGLPEVPQPHLLSGSWGQGIAHVQYKVCAIEPNMTET